MLQLFHAWRSSASRRVRLCLAEKGLDYDSRVIDMVAMEHHAPAYLAINPNGVVPALLHDGRAIVESAIICEYLDEVFPDPPLMPAEPYARQALRNLVRFMDDKCLPALIVFNWRHHLQPMAAQWSDAELQARLARIPSKERQEAWLRVARRPFTEAERDTARAQLLALLDRMEAALQHGPWLAGADYSIADIAAAPFLRRIEEEIAPEAVSDEARPCVAAMWRRLQARPAFAAATIQGFAAAPEAA